MWCTAAMLCCMDAGSIICRHMLSTELGALRLGRVDAVRDCEPRDRPDRAGLLQAHVHRVGPLEQDVKVGGEGDHHVLRLLGLLVRGQQAADQAQVRSS